MKNAEKEALQSINPDLRQVNYLRKKRHQLVDSSGLLHIAMVRSAGIQHRDGGLLLLATLCGIFPMLATMFADSAYGRTIFSAGLMKLLSQLNVNIISRSNNSGFRALLKRWIVGCTIAWLNRCVRLAKHWKNLNSRPYSGGVESSSRRHACACRRHPRFALLATALQGRRGWPGQARP